MSKKISVIFGTRPEAIKLATVVKALKADDRFDCRVCVTGQHREMLDQVLEVFGIEADADLALMRANQTLGGLTSRAIGSLDDYMAAESPDLILVQGDTTTVFCAAMAAFYHRVAIGHVEAGLRTGNMQSPWPEEANRVLTSRLAGLHFAPTEASRDNLLGEGVNEHSVFVTGNTVIDALLEAVERVRVDRPEVAGLPTGWEETWADRRMVLVTGHRRENFGEGFEEICGAIRELAERFVDVEFVYPVHLNPNVREPVGRILSDGDGGGLMSNVHLIEPQGYLSFVSLMDRASVILTDSGGVQEEAPSLGKPVLVMRDTTERPEAVEGGTVKLVGTDRNVIVDSVAELLTDSEAYDRMARAANPYGDGLATGRIVEACGAYLYETVGSGI